MQIQIFVIQVSDMWNGSSKFYIYSRLSFYFKDLFTSENFLSMLNFKKMTNFTGE